MSLIPSKITYGLAAILELASASGRDCLQIRDISNAQRIPEDYLRQLLLALKRAGIVRSVRGARGGYALTRHPSKITIREIFETLGGSMRLSSSNIADITLRSYLSELESKIERILDDDLENLVLRKQKATKNITYHI